MRISFPFGGSLETIADILSGSYTQSVFLPHVTDRLSTKARLFNKISMLCALSSIDIDKNLFAVTIHFEFS